VIFSNKSVGNKSEYFVKMMSDKRRKEFSTNQRLSSMPDIALIGDRTFLFEKLFQELGASYQFIPPGILGSPFLPKFKMIMIPTGFANPQYSNTLPMLQRFKSSLAGFIREGGILTVFGPLEPEHNYDWLPLPLKYVCELSSQQITPAQTSKHECSCLCSTSTPECDGYLLPGAGFDPVLEDSQGRIILAAGKYGQGLVVATSVHEFPAAEYIRWALCKAKPAKF
jgi:hypothetical protein